MNSSLYLRAIGAVLLMVNLAGCAGDEETSAGSGSSGASASAGSQAGGIPPTVEAPASGAGQESFNANVTTAPDDGATVSDIVRLEVEGYGIENAELLPAEGGRPYALFIVAPDNSRAWVDFDTRTVPNGDIRVKIEAYDQAARVEGARAVEAMSARTWTVQNVAITSPFPGEYPLHSDAAPLRAMAAMSDEEFARLIHEEWPRIHALLQEYIPDNVGFTPPVPRGFEGPRMTCIQDAYRSPLACREYIARIASLIQ